jgi:signal transduction histidine kinase
VSLEFESRTAAEDDFTCLAEISSDLVCLLSPDGRISFLNASGRRLLGLEGSLGEGLGRLCHEHVEEEDITTLRDALTQAARQEEPFEALIRFVNRGSGAPQPLWCRVLRRSPLALSGTPRLLLVGSTSSQPPGDPLSDVAVRSRMMELLTAVVGHDLRNPLHAILTGAHFVKRQSESPGARSAMTRIISSGHRMQRMIDQLLDLTRLRMSGGIPLVPVAVDLATVAQEAIQEIATANPGWQIALDIKGDTRAVCDEDRVTQMISNLLGNAVQHGTRQDGIRLSIDGTAEDAVTVSVQNGGTIPRDVLPVLFNPFRIVHQKRDKSTGLGLGLYITRQIALAHGGEVEAVSDAAGTTFTARLRRDATDVRSKRDDEMDEEIAAMEQFAGGISTAVTAKLFGSAPLQERSPKEFWGILERYGRTLDAALEQQTYKGSHESLSSELRAIAEVLGQLGAGAREVADVHARVLRRKTKGLGLPKVQALTVAGRLVSFELMGHLLSFYRRRSTLGTRMPPDA